ncbi:MAG: hypothetical protein R3C59_15510 [Planctomycetaceae bacterium]
MNRSDRTPFFFHVASPKRIPASAQSLTSCDPEIVVLSKRCTSAVTQSIAQRNSAKTVVAIEAS